MTSEVITIEDFIKIDLRGAKILNAEEVPDSRKMLKLEVDIGSEIKTIYAGIKKSYTPEMLKNQLVIVIANLKPREMQFGTSEGMMLATQNNDNIVILQPEKEVLPGAKIS